MRKLLILRPEPGASATAQRARALGLDPIVCPLFTVEAVAWIPPDPAQFDALLLTSANAPRHAGPGLTVLSGLPVIAVGEATAAGARAAGLNVDRCGVAGVGALLDALPAGQRLLHLAGDHRATAASAHRVTALTVYRTTAAASSLPALASMVALVHSPRAGARLADLADNRAGIAIAAISEAAAIACGSGWRSVDWPAAPDDRALLALAARLCQSPSR